MPSTLYTSSYQVSRDAPCCGHSGRSCGYDNDDDDDDDYVMCILMGTRYKKDESLATRPSRNSRAAIPMRYI